MHKNTFYNPTNILQINNVTIISTLTECGESNEAKRMYNIRHSVQLFRGEVKKDVRRVSYSLWF